VFSRKLETTDVVHIMMHYQKHCYGYNLAESVT